jgi:hypothetical protein
MGSDGERAKATAEGKCDTTSYEYRHNLYVTYRAQLEHEDNLIGIRNGWLIGGQAFLFAAYASALAVQSTRNDHVFFTAADNLYLALPWIGLALAVLAIVAVSAALRRSNRLCQKYLDLHLRPPHYPKIRPSSLFVVAWIYILVSR